jgi:hypothetical protein
MMANARERPHVVHGPYNFFAGGNNFANFVEGKHALIDPVKVYDIGVAKFGQIHYRIAGVGNGDIEERLARESVSDKDIGTFAIKIQFVATVASNFHYKVVGRLLVAYRHAGVYSCFGESIEQPIGGNGCTSLQIGCADDEDFHILICFRIRRSLLIAFAAKEFVRP